MEELLMILQEIRPDLDFEKETSLIDGEVLDSLILFPLHRKSMISLGWKSL